MVPSQFSIELEDYETEVLQEFIEKLQDMEDLLPEFSETVTKHFWELT